MMSDYMPMGLCNEERVLVQLPHSRTSGAVATNYYREGTLMETVLLSNLSMQIQDPVQ